MYNTVMNFNGFVVTTHPLHTDGLKFSSVMYVPNLFTSITRCSIKWCIDLIDLIYHNRYEKSENLTFHVSVFLAINDLKWLREGLCWWWIFIKTYMCETLHGLVRLALETSSKDSRTPGCSRTIKICEGIFIVSQHFGV